MKTKISLTLILSAILIFIGTSCNKDNTPFTHPTMKPWFDSKCASCHAPGASAALKWKYDVSDYEGSIKDHIDHLYNVVYVDKSMPPTALDSSSLATFKSWYDAGYSAE